MTNRKIIFTILVIIFVKIVTSFANEGQNKLFSLTGQFGYLFYNVEGYNNFVKSFKKYVNETTGVSGSIDEMDGGIALGMRAGYYPFDKLHFSIGIYRVSTISNTELKYKFSHSVGETTFRLKTKILLIPTSFRTHFTIPIQSNKIQSDLFAEISYNFIRYKMEVGRSTPQPTKPLPNSTKNKTGYALGMDLSYYLIPQFALLFEAKYNFLKVDNFQDQDGDTVKFPGSDFTNPEKSGSNVSIDFSGFLISFGVSYKF